MRSVLYDGGGYVERYGRKLLMLEVRGLAAYMSGVVLLPVPGLR